MRGKMKSIKRTKTKSIKVGNIYIGGSDKIVIQSMTNTKTQEEIITRKVSDYNRLAFCGIHSIKR